MWTVTKKKTRPVIMYDTGRVFLPIGWAVETKSEGAVEVDKKRYYS